MIKMILKKALLFLKYLYGKVFFITHELCVSVLSSEDTLINVQKNKLSVVRYGDGEIMFIGGAGFPFQEYNRVLGNRLKETLKCTNNKVLVCIPETVQSCKNIKTDSKWRWTFVLAKEHSVYNDLLDENYAYGNAFISRPYIVYKDKSGARKVFELLKQLWDQKNVLIVEGQFSRSGVGNDLFSNAKSVSRILCPAKNAFSVYEEILKAVVEAGNSLEDPLVLLALGPAAKPMVVDLTEHGFWTIDIGHIDSEYEWFLRGADTKIKIKGKHTADTVDVEIANCEDEAYLASIMWRIGINE
jgi:glycosyltransferase family protein